VNADGTGYSVLHNFNDANASSWPNNALIQGFDGRLYGTTAGGGVNGVGDVFALNTNGAGYIVLFNFPATQVTGAFPSGGLIQGRDGMLYGTASGGGSSGFGTVFKLRTNGTAFTVLHSFTGADGAGPCSLRSRLGGSPNGLTINHPDPFHPETGH
jgi:uncharacterized repeat protein (TIGR03803 family)